MPEQRLTLLAVLIGRDEHTHDEIVAQFERHARSSGEDATLSVRTLRRWIAGDVRTLPRPPQRRVARMMWGFPMPELLGPPPAEGGHVPVTDTSIEDPVLGATAPPARPEQASPLTDELDGSTAP